jgi:putative endonuclease
MKHFVYILFSVDLDRYYIGSAENIEERLKKHLGNHKGFTGKAKDWEIKYKKEFDTKDESLRREKQLKSWKNRTRIEQLIAKVG